MWKWGAQWSQKQKLGKVVSFITTNYVKCIIVNFNFEMTRRICSIQLGRAGVCLPFNIPLKIDCVLLRLDPPHVMYTKDRVWRKVKSSSQEAHLYLLHQRQVDDFLKLENNLGVTPFRAFSFLTLLPFVWNSNMPITDLRLGIRRVLHFAQLIQQGCTVRQNASKKITVTIFKMLKFKFSVKHQLI